MNLISGRRMNRRKSIQRRSPTAHAAMAARQAVEAAIISASCGGNERKCKNLVIKLWKPHRRALVTPLMALMHTIEIHTKTRMCCQTASWSGTACPKGVRQTEREETRNANRNAKTSTKTSPTKITCTAGPRLQTVLIAQASLRGVACGTLA